MQPSAYVTYTGHKAKTDRFLSYNYTVACLL